MRCENVRTSTDTLWQVFDILTEPVPYTCVSVNRRNNEARAHTGYTEVVLYGRFWTISIRSWIVTYLLC